MAARKPSILAFAASLRKNSLNKKLARAAASAARDAGAEVTMLDLREYPLPIYDGDLEADEGLPENALRLKKIFERHDGYIVVCPEYNSSFTPLFKNTIDWASRSVDGKPGLAWARGKTAAVLTASPGALGGMRALPQIRSVLQQIGLMVVPKYKALSRARDAFDDDGNLVNDADRDAVTAVADLLVETTRRVMGQ